MVNKTKKKNLPWLLIIQLVLDCFMIQINSKFCGKRKCQRKRGKVHSLSSISNILHAMHPQDIAIAINSSQRFINKTAHFLTINKLTVESINES